MKSVSVVVPVYNEEGNVKELHEQILRTCMEAELDFEIIFVNDGSTDDTALICRELTL